MVLPHKYGAPLRDPELCYYRKVLKLIMTNTTFTFAAFSCHYFWRLWSLLYFWGTCYYWVISQNEYLPIIHLTIMGPIPQKMSHDIHIYDTFKEWLIQDLQLKKINVPINLIHNSQSLRLVKIFHHIKWKLLP